MDGVFMWTKVTGKTGSRLLKKNIEFGELKDYDDWLEFKDLPNYIPDGQQFKWYLLTWEKYKYGIR
jgi:hypothetical protein